VGAFRLWEIISERLFSPKETLKTAHWDSKIGTFPPLKIKILTPFFANGDAEKRIIEFRERHTVDVR